MRRSSASRPRATDRSGWAAAVAAAALVAYLGTLVFAPSDAQLLPVAKLDAGEAFTAAEVARGSEYRRPQALIGLAALAAQLVLLAVLVARRVRLPRRSALAGALLSLALTAIALPFGVVQRLRAQDVGLSTDSWLAWARDTLISAAIAAVFAALLAVVVLALVRRLPRTWWLPGAGVVVVAAAALTFAAPAVLDPLFNRFEPLPRGPLRADVLKLAREAGVRVDAVEVVDASRRTTAANAYVAGLGATKKVVLYDTIARDFPRAQARSILAHELAHERFSDVPRGLLYVALVAPFGVLAVALLSLRLAGRERAGTSAFLPALALAFLLVFTGVTWVSNGLSQRVEARADAWALRATEEPAAFAALQRRLALRNLSDVDPPALTHRLLSTHPTTLERLGMAEAFRR